MHKWQNPKWNLGLGPPELGRSEFYGDCAFLGSGPTLSWSSSKIPNSTCIVCRTKGSPLACNQALCHLLPSITSYPLHTPWTPYVDAADNWPQCIHFSDPGTCEFFFLWPLKPQTLIISFIYSFIHSYMIWSLVRFVLKTMLEKMEQKWTVKGGPKI